MRTGTKVWMGKPDTKGVYTWKFVEGSDLQTVCADTELSSKSDSVHNVCTELAGLVLPITAILPSAETSLLEGIHETSPSVRTNSARLITSWFSKS